MRPIRTGLITAAIGATAAVTMACSSTSSSTPSGTAAKAGASTVQTVMSGLDIPWDVSFFKNGDMLTSQRRGTLTLRTAAGSVRTINAPAQYSVFQGSEAGAMGLVVDPTTVHTYFYTCQSYQRGGKAVDVRVYRWKLSADGKSAAPEKTLVTGLPITSGRHTGCRVRFTPGYRITVGTGDAATGVNPQSLSSLGGKTLRVGANGEIPTDNPFYSRGGNARYITSYGHRNVQGVAVRPGTSQIWTQEQGTSRDDETNLLVNGGNYGYNPVPGYNESVPMTDTSKYPSAIRAKWSSGSSTVATSGLTFLEGSAWGRWNGALAVAELKGQAIRILTLDAAGNVKRNETMPEFNTTYGRIRTVQTGPGGALYVTTSNGNKSDKVLRVTPHAPAS